MPPTETCLTSINDFSSRNMGHEKRSRICQYSLEVSRFIFGKAKEEHLHAVSVLDKGFGDFSLQ